MTATTEWIAIDWGTSNVRAWGIAADGSHAFARSSDKGMARLKPAEFPAVLDELVGDAALPDPVEVVICGMAGARQGWQEAAYLDVPADLHRLAAAAVRPQGADPRFSVRILPGICQRQPGHEDVMRGEETQLLGLLHLDRDFEGTVILPGTHSKWVEIAGGRITRFSTAMTGELFETLSQHSVLRHSLAGERDGPATDDGLAAGLEAGLERPALLTASLFRTRAASLLSGKGADWCGGYLSGLLVGAEIAGHRDWLAAGDVPLIGSARLSATYARALSLAGRGSFVVDAAAATIAGLTEARQQ